MGKKKLTSMFFCDLEVLSNIERYWVARKDFYKLLINTRHMLILSTTHCKCIVSETCKVIHNS